MRILGVSEKWAKLRKPRWTTFRFTRRDRDWCEGEVVQVVYKPRSQGREILGIAKIVSNEPRWMVVPPATGPSDAKTFPACPLLTEFEAKVDGFPGLEAMKDWLYKRYDLVRLYHEPMNKLTVEWIGRDNYFGKEVKQ